MVGGWHRAADYTGKLVLLCSKVFNFPIQAQVHEGHTASKRQKGNSNAALPDSNTLMPCRFLSLKYRRNNQVVLPKSFLSL